MAALHDVVVVGSCMTDLVSYVPRLPKPGETLQGHRFSKGFGGKGANQCVMAARLGASTAMIAKLGDDTFGHDTLKNFQINNINTDNVQIINGVMSGVAPITVNDQGENAIVIIPGANSQLSPDDVTNASGIISNAKVLICQMEVPNDTTLEALKLAKKHNGDHFGYIQSGMGTRVSLDKFHFTTLFNAAPGQTGLSDDFIKNSDIMCINETEAELITGNKVTDILSAIRAVQSICLRGCGRVILTMGGTGIVYLESANTYHIPAEEVTVVDTTGAGDAFVGALAFYLSKSPNLSFRTMIERSCKIASHTVTLPGTQSSFIVDNLPKQLFSNHD